MINGDNVQGFYNRVFYFYQCFKNHKIGTLNNLEILKVKLDVDKLELTHGSPARRLSNLFWESLNWKNISIQLEDSLHFFDIGCGTGNYAYMYKRLTDKKFGSYRGLDHKSYDINNEFEIIIDDAENSFKYISEETNIVVSQSALEHIQRDLLTVNKITEALTSQNKKFLQIHLVPASSSIFLYLWHGWRQYSKKNLGLISDNLKRGFGVSTIAVPLGGFRSFFKHLKLITFPTYFGKLLKLNKSFFSKKNIDKQITNSVSKDLNLASNFPIFWAIIVFSEDITPDFLNK